MESHPSGGPVLPDNEVIAEWSLAEGTAWRHALTAGLLGACALTLIHECARAATRHAPRLDRLGQRALARVIRRAGGRPPRGWALYGAALAGDVIANGLAYALALTGTVKRPFGRGVTAGLLMGVGAIAVGVPPRRWRWPAKLMAVAAYALGGWVSAREFNALERSAARDLVVH